MEISMKVWMKKNLLWVVTFLTIGITTVLMPFFPDRIPMHYDMAGNIDRWGSKYENYIFPAIIFIMSLFWECLLRHFRKKQKGADQKECEEAANNGKVLQVVAVGMALMFSVMHYCYLYAAFAAAKGQMTESPVDANVVTNVCMGGFLIVIGNILPKAKLNSAVGLRTVWSMENDRTWAVSNRFAGKAFIVSGVLIVIESFVVGGIGSTLIMLGILIAAGIISTWYSARAYRKYKD